MHNELLKNSPKPYIPKKLPLPDLFALIDHTIMPLISRANASLGSYNGFLYGIPNPHILISPLTNQEAVLSSKLEGTHSTIEDILEFNAGNVDELEENDIKEILNYRSALFYAIDNMQTWSTNDPQKIPLSNRLIKNMHAILLQGVRGKNKNPGNFKSGQNFIGGYGKISFTPLPPELTEEYMGNLEHYIHYDEFDLLVQSAIIHAQFEMIHPFNDGNGRIGRLLIPLFLYYRNFLCVPTFYMSSYFEADRALYIQKLNDISENGDWKGWIEYYLKGVIEQSNSNISKAKSILYLYETTKNTILGEINSSYSIPLLDFIFDTPIFNSTQVMNSISCGNRGTVNSLLKQFEELDIISSNDKKRYKTYYFSKLLSIVE